jgi:hypothetical protein
VKGCFVAIPMVCLICVGSGCAPIEYSVVIVEASQAIAEAEVAGASCTPEQLDRLSPVTKNLAPDPGTELVSTDEISSVRELGEPMCDAPYEYYAAIEYLRKAREEVGYSDYEPALEYAREARKFARKARDIALNRNQERGR